ncbi:hypothetical protein GCM10010431_86860 [Streptomyces kunmingensis]
MERVERFAGLLALTEALDVGKRGYSRRRVRERTSTPPERRGGMRVEGDGCEALGRSRGGLTGEVHLLADDRALPLTWQISPGQRGDRPMLSVREGQAATLPESSTATVYQPHPALPGR